MERLTLAARNGAASALLDQKKFTHDSLIELGFDFMGFCWGGYNKPYYQIDCELGTICVVDYQDVYMVRGNREDKLCKITSKNLLKQFINLLDLS